MPDNTARARQQAEYQRRTGNKAVRKYEKENTVRISLILNKNTEPDLIDRLQTVDSKNGYIKSLIRADIAQGKE